MPYRHPSVLANIAATTDIISGGRLIIGLGAGWNQDESDALGIRLPPLKERMDQFEEGVQVIIALLSEPRANFSGQHFTLTDAWCEPKPIQRPHPPIAIGGNGERRTLRIVARFAQHWNSTLTDIGEWHHKCEVLDTHCAEVGRDPGEIERSVNVRLGAGQDPRELQPTIERWRDAGVDVCIVGLGTPHATLIGVAPDGSVELNATGAPSLPSSWPPLRPLMFTAWTVNVAHSCAPPCFGSVPIAVAHSVC